MAAGCGDSMRSLRCAGLALALLTRAAVAGPPYVSDDPEPTDYQHFEIYTFNSGKTTRDGTAGESGIDFNYGAAPNLQLTATLPAGFDRPAGGGTSFGMSDVELAAKYRFLHQDTFGLDVSVFPRIFLPTGTNGIGDNHVSLLPPVWVQKGWSGGWSAFGGGGCTGSKHRTVDFLPGGRGPHVSASAQASDARSYFTRPPMQAARRQRPASVSDGAMT
jgi:hypothetical protein